MEASLSSKNVCKSHHCVSCCYGTEMLLLEADVHRIVCLGFKEGFFAVESDGFKMLRNGSSGRCVFHDGKQCTIYSNRPSGCKLYPIIFDEGLNRAVKDRLCPYGDEFDLSLKARRELSDVYPRLLDESRRRHVVASLRAITSFEDDSTIGTNQEL